MDEATDYCVCYVLENNKAFLVAFKKLCDDIATFVKFYGYAVLYSVE